MLVNKCKIYVAHFKSLHERKWKNYYCGKLYSTLVVKGKQRALEGKKPSRGETLTSVKCFKCDELGHCANECKNNVLMCLKYGKIGHRISDCKSVGPTCYNCVEQGHINTNCQKEKKVQSRGKVFAMIRLETTSSDILIRGTCFINRISLIAIIDASVTHSFISLNYVERMGLKLSSMVGSMVIDTPAIGLVKTSWVCLNCPLTIYGKSFGMDLVCLPLN